MSVSVASNALIHHLRRSAALLLLVVGCLGLAVAQDKPPEGKLNVEDLKVRAEAGDKTATRQLADAYYTGRGGVEQNFSEAARWYVKLGQQGDLRAQTTLGLMYSRGYGVAKDLQAAHRWWSFAAAANDQGAQYNLGLAYADGEGVAQDYERAAQWYLKAAVRNHVQAQLNLGTLYYEGKGVPKDLVRAYYWFKLAALHGDDLAPDRLEKVGAEMTPNQVKDAETQATEMFKKTQKALK